MERLKQRKALVNKALSSLEEVLKIAQPSTIEKDATIQRFEYSIEAQWKFAQQFLRDIEGLDVGSPKGVIRACREVGILDEHETIQGLEMVDDRNLTSHTYNETLAKEIFSRIPNHYQLLKIWFSRIVQRIDE